MIFICALAALVVGRTVTWRMWEYLNKLNQQIEKDQVLLAQAKEEIKENAEYLDKWDNISGFQEVAVEESQRKFSAYLQSLIEFADLSPSIRRPMEGHDLFQELGYTLTFSADLEDLVEFLAKLDASERLLLLDRLEITNKWKSSFGGLYEMRVPSSKDLLVKVTFSIPAAPEPSETVIEDEEWRVEGKE
ncbi:MAG: hypothetical protein KAT56_01460 [Sedimentisphaerales bacterium]|nr:hypothetical protein [Sedimentisphaerales bacterium]